jgi:hypothetical protein
MWDEENKKTAKEWKPTSDRTDAIQYILAVTECPKDVRSLISILIGISNGHPEFETTQAEIASRISGTVQLAVDESAKEWVKRAHRKFRKWQKERQLNLIEYEPGGRSKDKTRHYKSRYNLHIFHFADKVIKLAQQNPLWDKNKSQAIERAAKELKSEYQPIEIMYHRRKPSSGSKLRSYIQSSISYANQE